MTKSFTEIFLTGPPFFWDASRFLFKSALNLCQDMDGIKKQQSVISPNSINFSYGRILEDEMYRETRTMKMVAG